jgi:hypothetical protein
VLAHARRKFFVLADIAAKARGKLFPTPTGAVACLMRARPASSMFSKTSA